MFLPFQSCILCSACIQLPSRLFCLLWQQTISNHANNYSYALIKIVLLVIPSHGCQFQYFLALGWSSTCLFKKWVSTFYRSRGENNHVTYPFPPLLPREAASNQTWKSMAHKRYLVSPTKKNPLIYSNNETIHESQQSCQHLGHRDSLAQETWPQTMAWFFRQTTFGISSPPSQMQSLTKVGSWAGWKGTEGQHTHIF